ncbi:hypothetical protein M3Y98_00407300 [Aphelenchoides besseyi]|nr:hypothetical protein M3Y98_00407300 [Aphelenchoides besseyi]
MCTQQSNLIRLILASVLISVLVHCTNALTCFETNDDGDMVEVSNDEWTYCVILPERIEDNKFVEGRAFGVGPNSDSTTAYDKMFAVSSDLYRILSLCVQERYDFGRISPKFTFKQPEFMLRCFCNYDLCNKKKKLLRLYEQPKRRISSS